MIRESNVVSCRFSPAVVVVVVAVAICLGACGRERTEPAPPAPTPAVWTLKAAAAPYRGKTITIIGEDYAPMQALEKLKGDFESQTGIKVNVERYEAETVLEKIALDLNSKRGRYDVIVQVYFDMGRLAARQQLRPMAPMLNSSLHNPAFNPDRDLLPVWRSMGSYRGTHYGYPMMVLTMYVWYRKDLFEDPAERQRFRQKYGYDLRPPETWEEYREIAEFFTRPEQGIYGTLIQGRRHIALWQEYLNFLYGFGGEVMKTRDPSRYGQVAINSPAAKEATAYYKSLVRYSPPDTLAFTWDDALALMQQGRVAMCVMWNDATYALEDPQQSKVAGKMGYSLLPVGKAGRPHQVGGQSFFIPSTSKNPQAAYLFIEWMLQSDIQVRQQRLGGASPRPSTYADAAVRRLPWTTATLAALEHAHPAMLYTVPESLRIGETIQSELSDYLAGRKTVEHALDAAAAQIAKDTAAGRAAQ